MGAHWYSGIWAEELDGVTFTNTIASLAFTCHNCGGDVTAEDIQDVSRNGHDACGLSTVMVYCWECGTCHVMTYHEGCLINTSTIDPERGNERDDSPDVGAKFHVNPVGASWNWEEGRPMTYRDTLPFGPLPRDQYVDYIPF